MLMQATQATTTHRVFPGQMNEHDSLFGGQTLAWLDEAASIAAHRFAHRELVTGSLDHMVYVAPVLLGHALTYHSVVSGAGTKSLEVFTKLIGEDVNTNERYLAGYAFTTFVATGQAALPSLEATTADERMLLAGYLDRRAANKAHLDTPLPLAVD